MTHHEQIKMLYKVKQILNQAWKAVDSLPSTHELRLTQTKIEEAQHWLADDVARKIALHAMATTTNA